MKVYVAHSTKFDYHKELYEPLRSLGFDFIFPHEHSEELFDSKTALKDCDLMLAEVSLPSTGLGIEAGWADAFGVPIVCLVKKGKECPRSINSIAQDVIVYDSKEQLIDAVKEIK